MSRKYFIFQYLNGGLTEGQTIPVPGVAILGKLAILVYYCIGQLVSQMLWFRLNYFRKC